MRLVALPRSKRWLKPKPDPSRKKLRVSVLFYNYGCYVEFSFDNTGVLVSSENRFDSRKSRAIFGVIIPIAISSFIYLVDGLEGPTVQFAGVATSVAFMAAIFGRPGSTAFVATMVVLGAFLHGLFFDAAGTTVQLTRLGLIAITAYSAVIYSAYRVRKEEEQRRLQLSKLALEETSRLAMRDQLTSVLNRRGVLEALQKEENWPKSVAIFDLDKLKFINDTHGHAAGDDYIRIVAQRIASAVSSVDIVGRWGGDEFIVVLHLTKHQALKVVQRVVDNVSSQPLNLGGVTIEPRLSAGVAEWQPIHSLEHTLSGADAALYEAKASGGNTARLCLP